MTRPKPLPPIVQCESIGSAVVAVNPDWHSTTGKVCMVCARHRRLKTWISGPARKTEREAINAWNRWIAQMRFGEWRPE